MAFLSNFSGSVVLSACNSPVSVDSLTVRFRDSSSLQSAGISSPCSKITMSPTTMSRRGIWQILLFRIVLTGVSSLTSLSDWNVFSFLRSKKNATPVAKSNATMIPIGSKNVDNPALFHSYS